MFLAPKYEKYITRVFTTVRQGEIEIESLKRDRPGMPGGAELIKWGEPTTTKFKFLSGRGAVNIRNCKNAFKTSHHCKLAFCGPCYDKYQTGWQFILQSASGNIVSNIFNKKSRNYRHKQKPNLSVADVGIEGDYGDCDKAHTYGDLEEP